MIVELTKKQYEAVRKKRAKKALETRRANIKKAKEEDEKAAKEVKVAPISEDATTAIRAAEAAVSAAEAAKDVANKTMQDTKVLMVDIVKVISGNQVTKLKINRDKNKIMTSIDIVRSTI